MSSPEATVRAELPLLLLSPPRQMQLPWMLSKSFSCAGRKGRSFCRGGFRSMQTNAIGVVEATLLPLPFGRLNGAVRCSWPPVLKPKHQGLRHSSFLEASLQQNRSEENIALKSYTLSVQSQISLQNQVLVCSKQRNAMATN